MRRVPSTASRRWLLTLAVTMLAGGAAFYLQVLVPEVSKQEVYTLAGVTFPARETLLVLGVMASVVALGAPLLLAGLEAARAAGASAERQTLLTGAFLPLADALAELAVLPETAAKRPKREGLRGQAVTTVLAGLVNVFGDPSRVRACWYELERVGSDRKLTPKLHLGRPGLPGNTFVDDGNEPGRSVFAALDAGEARYWHKNMPGPTPPGYSTSKNYRAYISVPVVTAAGSLGMLTVDSTDPNCFRMAQAGSVSDVELVELFARLLTASLTS